MATSVQDFLKMNPGYVGYANTANQTAPINNAPTKKKGRGGFLSSLISELGGASGAAGGAALGATVGSVVPGLGTAIGGLIGAGIGGFTGGTVGRGVENKVRDDQNFFGKGGSAKSAFGEGALSGALSGLGEGYQLAKAGKAITETKGIANLGKNIVAGGEKRAADIAEKQALKDIGQKTTQESGRLGNIGSAFRSQPRGIVAGVDQGSTRGLSTAEAKARNAAIDEATKGAKGLTKTGQFTAIEKRINSLTNAYKLTPEAKAALTEDDILKLMQGVEGNITANTSLRNNLTKSSQTTLNNIYDDFSKMTGKTRGDLVDYAAQVNKKASAIVNKGQVGSKEVQIWEEVRNATKDFIDNSPSFADKSGVNKKLSTLLGARADLTKAVSADVNAGARSGLTLGRALSDVASPVLDVTGRALQIAGKGTASPIGRNIIRQAPASASRSVSGSGQPQDQVMQPQGTQQQDQTLYGAGVQAGLGNAIGGMQQPQQSAYPLEQAIADIQAHPDAKSRKNIMDYYDFVQSAEKAQSKSMGGKYNSTASGVIADTTTGLQSLVNLKGSIAASGANSPGIGQLRGLNPFDTEAQNLQSQIGTVKQIVGKALEGGVLRKEDEIKYAKILPKLGDSDAVAQNKIDQLIELISSRLETYQNSLNGYQETPQYQMQGAYQ